MDRTIWRGVGLLLSLSLGGACTPPVDTARTPDGITHGVSAVRTPPSAGLPEPLILTGFLATTPLGRCRGVDGPGATRSVTPTPGGHFLALGGSGREVSLLDPGLTRVASARVPSTGTGRILDPVDAWLLGDSVLLIADGAGRALHLLPWSAGALAPGRRVPLPFVPHRVIPLAGETVAVVPLSANPSTLVYTWSPGEGLVDRGLSPPFLPDPRLRILAGALSVTRTSGGGVVLAHPLLVPSLYHMTVNQVDRYPVAVSDAETHAVGWVPEPPFDEEDVLGMLAPALALAPGPEGMVLQLTRSGARRRGVREKALLMLDGSFQPVAGVRLPVNAVLVAGSAPDGGVLLMDAAGSWFRCDAPTPRSGGDPAPGPDAPVPSRHGQGRGQDA